MGFCRGGMGAPRVLLIVVFEIKICHEILICMLQALKTRVSNLPNVKKFLQPGSQRKPYSTKIY